jgi:hypothetical protein
MTAHDACVINMALSSARDNTVCTVSNGSTFLWHKSARGVSKALDITFERRILELCAQAVTTRDAHEFRSIVSEL